LKNFINQELIFFKYLDINLLTYIISGVVVILFIFNFFKNRIYLFALLTLPATLFHELSHFIISLITGGMPRGLSIWPQKSENGYTLGYVESYNVTWFNAFLIGFAPILLIPIAYIFLKYNVVYDNNPFSLSWKIYLLASLIEGSIPSITDISLAIKKSLFLIWFIFIFIGITYF